MMAISLLNIAPMPEPDEGVSPIDGLAIWDTDKDTEHSRTNMRLQLYKLTSANKWA
jgi:hypothetical protein